jgi:hypothetical protein
LFSTNIFKFENDLLCGTEVVSIFHFGATDARSLSSCAVVSAPRVGTCTYHPAGREGARGKFDGITTTRGKGPFSSPWPFRGITAVVSPDQGIRKRTPEGGDSVPAAERALLSHTNKQTLHFDTLFQRHEPCCMDIGSAGGRQGTTDQTEWPSRIIIVSPSLITH